MKNPAAEPVPLSEVQQQLGHARIESTSAYTKLAIAKPEARAIADWAS